MKHWIVNIFISIYLSILSFGLAAHALDFLTQSNPGMYFVVWDMFCGWSAYAHRYHIIGESNSGRYYELAPGPWGQFHPYGDLPRQEYDTAMISAYRIAMNTLNHTDHEPIHRLYMIEETWSKKFNLPDYLWWRVNDVPKNPHSYYSVRRVVDTDGTVQANLPSWHDRQAYMHINDNPRLMADVKRSEPLYAVDIQAKNSKPSFFKNGYEAMGPTDLNWLGN